MSCCCYADSWHSPIVKSLKKFMVSLSLPHPVLEQVIFEPGGIRTQIVMRQNSFSLPRLCAICPLLMLPLSLQSFGSQILAIRQGQRQLGSLIQGTALARKALPTPTISLDCLLMMQVLPKPETPNF